MGIPIPIRISMPMSFSTFPSLQLSPDCYACCILISKICHYICTSHCAPWHYYNILLQLGKNPFRTHSPHLPYSFRTHSFSHFQHIFLPFSLSVCCHLELRKHKHTQLLVLDNQAHNWSCSCSWNWNWNWN